jgi:hypothetical protein
MKLYILLIHHKALIISWKEFNSKDKFIVFFQQA